jgi:hypothetical protein
MAAVWAGGPDHPVQPPAHVRGREDRSAAGGRQRGDPQATGSAPLSALRIGESTHFPGVPFGGMKRSGVGREESLDELLSYTQLKTVNIMLG